MANLPLTLDQLSNPEEEEKEEQLIPSVAPPEIPSVEPAPLGGTLEALSIDAGGKDVAPNSSGFPEIPGTPSPKLFGRLNQDRQIIDSTPSTLENIKLGTISAGASVLEQGGTSFIASIPESLGMTAGILGDFLDSLNFVGVVTKGAILSELNDPLTTIERKQELVAISRKFEEDGLFTAGRDLLSFDLAALAETFESDQEREIFGTPARKIVGLDEVSSGLLAIGAKVRRTLKFDEGTIIPGFWTRDLPGAVGQSASFAATAMLAARFGLRPGLSTAILGSAVGGAEGAREAIAFGATEEQVKMAFLSNAAFGVSEAMPAMKILERVDDATAGFFTRSLKRLPFRSSEPVLRAATRGFLEEAIQESFQAFGANITASDIAGFDPTRPLHEGLADAARIGGSAGFLMNALAVGFGLKVGKFRRRDLDVQDAILKRLAVIDPNNPENVAGVATLLGATSEENAEFLRLMQAAGEANEKLKGYSSRSVASLTEYFEQVANDSTMSLQARALAANALKDIESEAATLLIPAEPGNLTSKLPNRVIITDLRNELSIVEMPPESGFQPGTTASDAIVASKAVFIAGDVKTREAVESQADALHILEVLKEQGVPSAFAGLNIDAEIAAAKTELKKRQQRLEIETELRITVQAFVSDIQKKLFPGLKVIAVDKAVADVLQMTNLVSITLGEGTTGYAVAAIDAQLLAFDLNQVTDNLTLNSEGNLIVPERVRGDFFDTLMHEAGHAIFQQQIRKASAEVRKAIRLEYEAWRIRVANGTGADFLAGITLGRAANTVNLVSMDGSVLDSTLFDIDYLTSFAEWQAETVAKHAAFQEITNPVVKEYFEEVRQAMEAAYNNIISSAVPAGSFKLERPPTTEAFIESLAAREQFRKKLDEIKSSGEIVDRLTAWKKLTGLEGNKELDDNLDTFNRFLDNTLNILQVGRLNEHITGLQEYIDTTRQWSAFKNNRIAIAQERIKQWRQLGKKDARRLAKFLYEETLSGDFIVPPGLVLSNDADGNLVLEGLTEEQKQKIKEAGLNEQTLRLAVSIKEDFNVFLDEMEAVLNSEIKASELTELEKQGQLAQVLADFTDMRSKPFFPLERFGKLAVVVKDSDGKVLEFSTRETPRARRKLLKQIKSRFAGKDVTIAQSRLSDTEAAVQMLPIPLIRSLKTRLNLTEEQRKELDELIIRVSPVQSFRRHFLHREGLPGFAMDAMRSYANYFFLGSSHLARIKFNADLQRSIGDVEDTARAITDIDGGNATKRRQILDHMRNHLDYIMNPKNEYQSIRALGFIWFLGFNVKAAVLNTTQVPLVTFPRLAAEFGDAAALKEIAKANRDAIRYWTNPELLADEELQLLARGKEEGWLDESLAATLAAVAQEDMLDRALPVGGARLGFLKISQASAWLFHNAEKLNRNVTALSAYRLARKEGRGVESSFQFARRVVDDTQFEYSKWNRPKMFRGGKGVVFLFLNYVQNVLFFAFGGAPGAMRFWYMMMLMGGLQGLPFADDLLDVIDFLGTKLKRELGWKNPKLQSRVLLREYIKELTDNPDLLLHGISSESFGMAAAGQLTGLPIPSVDMSASIGLGNLLPTEGLTTEGNFDKAFIRTTERASGAVGSGVMRMMQAVRNDDPDLWKRTEKFMPAFLANASKAGRFAVAGEERARSGELIAEFDLQDPIARFELIGQFLGFTPTRRSKGWAKLIAKRELIQYYEGQRKVLFAGYNWAKERDDKEAIKDAWQEVLKYNKQVPFPEMKISGGDLTKSVVAKKRARALAERNIEAQRSNRRLGQTVEEVFEEKAPEDK